MTEFLKTEKGAVIACPENILIGTREIYFGQLRYDAWKDTREILDYIYAKDNEPFSGEKKWRPLEDVDYLKIQSSLANAYPHRALQATALGNVQGAVMQICHDNAIDSAKEYINSLVGQWDEMPRLDTWLSVVYGVQQNDYYKAVGSNWLKGMINRIYHPGCKFDYVLVLEGNQGIGKSTSLEIIGGEWYAPITVSANDKDFYMTMRGRMLVEFSEGETMSRSEVKQLKAVISALSDVYRPPYGREVKEYPRRCVFAMSTNQSEYLKDETGNRRWLPVACEGKVNLAWLKENRTQLLAEAVYRVLGKKETTYEFPEEETAKMQSSRVIENPEEEGIVEWYALLSDKERQDGISPKQAHEAIQPKLGYLKVERFTKADQMRIVGILQYALFLKKDRVSKNGNRIVRYFPTAETLKLLPVESNINANIPF